MIADQFERTNRRPAFLCQNSDTGMGYQIVSLTGVKEFALVKPTLFIMCHKFRLALFTREMCLLSENGHLLEICASSKKLRTDSGLKTADFSEYSSQSCFCSANNRAGE